METQLHTLEALVSYLERELNYVDPVPLAVDELRSIIAGGTRFLQNAQEENGHFRYEYAPYEDHSLPGDNLVRQAGALFELGEVARRDTERKLAVGEHIERAITYFEALSREDELDGTTFRCITAEGSRRCKLGTTALALSGILGYVEAYPEKAEQYEELIEDYISYIKVAKLEDGGFRYIHRVGADAQSDRESSFSNGEALLALVRYYQHKPSDEVRDMSLAAFTHLKDTEFDSGLYLWVMAALKDMQTLWPDPTYAEYAKAYTQWRMDSVGRHKHTKHNYCAYAEGLASAYSVFSASVTPEERLRLKNELDYWNRKNAGLQIGEDDQLRYHRNEGPLELLTIENMERARGGFLTGHDELTQRIDFTQHCISAYLQTLVDIEGNTL